MKVRELVGKDIMMAYDGDYLSSDFGYSCANFNVKWNFHGNSQDDWRFFDAYKYGGKPNEENDEATFDFYTVNKKNISCFVCFNDRDKICGRRMFFKGHSMVNDKEFDNPLKRGQLVKYLYGYYGNRDPLSQKQIGAAMIEKYGKGIVYTDSFVLNNGVKDFEIPNFWIMGVSKTEFGKYPPVDGLSVSTELNALANFDPRRYILTILERDYKKSGIKFHRAYRFDLGDTKKKHYNYTTWADHQGVVKSYKDLIKDLPNEEVDEEEEEEVIPKTPPLLLSPPTNEPEED